MCDVLQEIFEIFYGIIENFGTDSIKYLSVCCCYGLGAIPTYDKNSEQYVSHPSQQRRPHVKLTAVSRIQKTTISLIYLYFFPQTGKTLGAGLYYLASNKESQDALRKELLHLLPSKDTPLTNEILSEAQYLKAVVKEITRLATVAVGNVRATVKDMVICGYQIPEGVSILIFNLTYLTLE